MSSSQLPQQTRAAARSVFATGEAAPGTVFYRATAEARPTLQDLLDAKASFFISSPSKEHISIPEGVEGDGDDAEGAESPLVPESAGAAGAAPAAAASGSVGIGVGVDDIPVTVRDSDASPTGELGDGRAAAESGGAERPSALPPHVARVQGDVAGAGKPRPAKSLNGNGGGRADREDIDDDQEVTVAPAPKKLGWQNGVLVPVLLNIWGVIMFARLGWVVGQAGVWYGTLIVVASNVVTFITALSLCAICTNGVVRGGGAYYLISRALGPSYGGAIGILFFVAQAVATSMYVVGFAESLIDIFRQGGAEPFTGDWGWDQRIIGLITCTVLLGVAMVGVGWYAKAQVFLLFTLVVSMISVVLGAFFPDVPDAAENAARGFVGGGDPAVDNVGPNFSTDPNTLTSHSFFSVFAIFFPAVTGIMAGANMSGDLEDPSTAIPRGTLMGIAITFVTYVGLLWLIGSVSLACVGSACSAANFGSVEWATDVDSGALPAPDGGLLFNKLIMADISIFAPLVYAGVFSATLSSALASLVGAPRILQAVARDMLFPKLFYFAQDDKPGEQQEREPVRGYVLTYVISMGCVLIGELDLIAPLISNFFMISYGLTNYACFAASMASAPGWRPTFRFYHKYLSLAGALLCVAVMFAFDVVNSLVSFFIGGLLFKYLEYYPPNVDDWGPAGAARKYLAAVNAMSALVGVTGEGGRMHTKSFRPQYLVLTGDLALRPHLARFVARLHNGKGIMVAGQVVLPHETLDRDGNRNATGSLTTADIVNTLQRRRTEGMRFLRSDALGSKRLQKLCFMEAVFARDRRTGLGNLLSLSGMGSLRPNVVVVGYKRDWPTADTARVEEYENMMLDVLRHNYGLVVVRDDEQLFGRSTDEDVPFETLVTAGSHEDAQRAVANIKSRRFTATVTAALGGAGDDRAAPASDGDEAEAAAAAAGIGGPSATPTEVDAPADGTTAASASAAMAEAAGIAGIAGPSSPRANGNGGGAKARSSTIPGLAGGTSMRSIGGAAPALRPTIDVWWLIDEGGLSLLLPHLLRLHGQFRNYDMRVMTVGDWTDPKMTRIVKKSEATMVHTLAMFRIKADVVGINANPYLPPRQDTIDWFMGVFPTCEAFLESSGWRGPYPSARPGAPPLSIGPAAADGGAEEDARGGDIEEAADAAIAAVEAGGADDGDTKADEEGTPTPVGDASPLTPKPSRPRVDMHQRSPSFVRRATQGSHTTTRRMVRLGEIIRDHTLGQSADCRTDLVFVTTPLPQPGAPPRTYLSWLEALSYKLPPTIMMRGNNEDVLTFYS